MMNPQTSTKEIRRMARIPIWFELEWGTGRYQKGDQAKGQLP